MSQQGLTRKGLHEVFSDDPKGMYQEAMDKKLTLPDLFREKVNDEIEKSEDRKLDPLNWMLRKEQLSIRSTASHPSSSVEEFMANDATKQLFWSVLDNDYDQNFGLEDLDKIAADGTITDAGAVDNSPFKVRYTTALSEQQRFAPRVRIADIAATVETIPGTSFQQPEFRGDSGTTEDERQAAERSRDIGEAGRIPTTTLRVGTTAGQTKKIGEGLRISTEATFNELYMESVRIWVRRLAMRDEIRMVNEGINILDTIVSGTTRAYDRIGATPNLASILEVNMYGDSGYQYNLLITERASAAKWIEANVRANGYPLDVPAGRFNSALPGIQLVNTIGAPTRLAFVSDTETNLEDNQMLAVDQRFALSLKRTARGMVDEEIYDARHQVRERYITQRYGWHVMDAEAVVGWLLLT